jgi:hypothetical protein
MNPGSRQPMTAVSSGNWIVTTDERPSGLEVILLKRTYVLPWNQFLYAEGGEDEIRLAFTTHDVVVNGSHLDSLLADLCAQRVSLLREPARAERFRHGSGPQITGVSVRKVE